MKQMRTKKKMEQDGLDILCQAKITRFLEREEVLDQNLNKACALICSTYCDKTMQNRIEEHPDFESKTRDDPIEPLKAIKVLMHDPIRAKYPFASLTEAISRTLNIKQMENEGLLDHTKRFKQARDIMKSHVGKDVPDNFVENTPECRNETNTTKAVMVCFCLVALLQSGTTSEWGGGEEGAQGAFELLSLSSLLVCCPKPRGQWAWCQGREGRCAKPAMAGCVATRSTLPPQPLSVGFEAASTPLE